MSTFCRFVTLMFSIGLLANGASARVSYALGSSPPFLATSDAMPLSFRIKVSSRKCPAGRRILVRAALKNISNKPIVIDRLSLWYQIRAQSYVVDSDGGRSFTDFVGTGHDGPTLGLSKRDDDYIVLRPGMEFKDRNTIEVGESFNLPAGAYRFTLTYGQFQEGFVKGHSLYVGVINSNSVDIIIENPCP